MESQLKFVKKTAYEVSMKVVVKLEDITEDEIKALFALELLGEPIDIKFQHFQKAEQKQDRTPIEKSVVRLQILMKEYCQKYNKKEWEERVRLLEKYKVAHRSELSEVELQHEIRSYQAGIENNF